MYIAPFSFSLFHKEKEGEQKEKGQYKSLLLVLYLILKELIG